MCRERAVGDETQCPPSGTRWRPQWSSVDGASRAGRQAVMNPMAKARGVQLARNDQAAACGGMTSARQRRTPAAWAPSRAWVRSGGGTPSGGRGTFYPGDGSRQDPAACAVFQVPPARLTRCPQRTGVPEHTGTLPRDAEAALTPLPQARGLRAANGESTRHPERNPCRPHSCRLTCHTGSRCRWFAHPRDMGWCFEQQRRSY